MDDLFTRYMYYLRAKEGNKESTTESLRRFYSRDKFKYLHNEQTIVDMELLANFWNDVVKQNANRFSPKVLNLLFILHYAPNGLWQYLTSVYYLTNKNNNDELSDDDFYSFLRHSIGFIWAHAIVNPGVNALRTPAYAEMVNIVNGRFANFAAYKFDEYRVRSAIENYEFTNQRTVTRSMLTWYAFTFADQTLPRLDASFDIEHIYPRNRQKFEHGLSDDKLIDKLGNKILLESNINIKASDYRFEDKKKFYSGEMRRRGDKKPSIIAEISDLIQLPDFTEADIIARNNRIIDTFIEYLRREDLLR